MISSRQTADILEPRRKEYSNFMWVSRQLKPQIAFKQSLSPSPQFHKERVLKSPVIQELLEKISKERNVSKKQLETEVKNILNEIGYNRNLSLIRWLGLILVKICRRMYSTILVNEVEVFQMKSAMGHCPVIFLPSHRSYADFIMMSLMCFHLDLAIPAIAAGMDFHGMWGMGKILRDTGAFFMRRSYNEDSLYWSTFKQYIYQIVTEGELPLEFFIEGTRSRSGKSLVPKYGLILMVLKAFFLRHVPDILFVPINISYDRVLEEKLFAWELLGIPKPKESTTGFFKSLSILRENYGNIYVHFAKPISARKFFDDQLSSNRSAHNFNSTHRQEITEEEKQLVPPLAHTIIYSQQKHCVITPFNLIAILLANNLTNGQDLFTVERLHEEVVWLKDVMNRFGAYVHLDDVKESVKQALEVHSNVVTVNSDQKVTLLWNKLVLDKFDETKMKGHSLSPKTVNYSIPFVLLQLYVNPALHYLVDAAILVVILTYCKKSFARDELLGHYRFLRSLLSQEFVTFKPRETLEFEMALETSQKLNLIQQNTEGLYELGDNKKLEQVLCTTLDCFIYTYFVVCCVLEKLPNISKENTILCEVQAEIEMSLSDKSCFVHPYALSIDSITNCLNSLCSESVLSKSRREGTTFHEINKLKLSDVKNKLEHCIPSSQVLRRKLESVQLHLKNKL